MKQQLKSRSTLLASAALAALLTACGGGGDDAPPADNSVSQDTAQAMSADSSAMATDGTDGAQALMVTTQAVVASGSAGQTINCAGGGTAVFTVTGGSLAQLTNSQFDAGEVYSLTFNNCRGSAGAVALTGSATLTVVSAGAGVLAINTATQNLQVALPLRTLTYNGSSSLSQTVTTNGATTTTVNRWTSPRIEVRSVRGGRTSTFTLSNVDLSRTFVQTGGVISGRSAGGTYTLDAVLPNGSWSITVATQGAVNYDANGAPTQGAWTITLPNHIIGINVVPGTLTVTVDIGADGSIDRTYVFSTTTIVNEAD
jgi:hypothetical protein